MSIRIGVNYVPSGNWWYSWVDWNEKSILEDLDAMAGLGVDHIRVHCLWPLFQPNATFVSPTMVGRLRWMVQQSGDRGMDVCVVALDGWLSGFDFRPDWLGDANAFTDPVVRDAQRLLIATLGESLVDLPSFLGFDLGNEINVISRPGVNETHGSQGSKWSDEMLSFCQEVAPGRLHTNGVDHNPWLTDDTSFRRETLANSGQLVSVHAWSFFTGALERYGERGCGTIHLAEYMLELAKAYRVEVDRPVWLQEIGIAHQWLSSSSSEEFVRSALGSLSSVPDLWGITWWASHDIDRRFSGFEELEYDLGLLTINNEVKSMGSAFQEAAASLRSTSAPARSTALVLRSDTTPDLAFADQFFALIESGVRPAIVLEKRLTDLEHLQQRHITRLVEADHSGRVSSLLV